MAGVEGLAVGSLLSRYTRLPVLMLDITTVSKLQPSPSPPGRMRNRLLWRLGIHCYRPPFPIVTKPIPDREDAQQAGVEGWGRGIRC